MSDALATALSRFPIHLGRGGIATVQPAFTGDVEWYGGYGERTAADGVDGWLVSSHTFSSSWDVWEMHPHGHEIVICTAGTITLTQEHPDGTTDRVVLTSGHAAVNPPGTWHTADCETDATCIFVTSGMGTENRAR